MYDRNRKLAYQKKYRQEHLEEIRQKSAKRRANLKLSVFSHYSMGVPRCAFCGETELQNLTLDHIDGNGKEHRKKNNYSVGTQSWIWARKNNYPPIFQVLCRDCNLIRGFPHSKVLAVSKRIIEEGVLLQRLITDLPQQAKTTNDVVKWALDIKKGASMPYVNLTKAYKTWVALEALIPTEKKETKQ